MNKDNILAVADAIEKHSIAELGFNMSLYGGKTGPSDPDLSGHNCGTVACIAGWADKVLTGRDPDVHSSDYAQGLLGLSAEQAIDLFVPSDWAKNTITPAHAVAVLRNLAETGEVDWSVSVAKSP